MAKLQGMAKRDARSTAVAATIFLFPAVALLVVYMIYPIVETFLISRPPAAKSPTSLKSSGSSLT